MSLLYIESDVVSLHMDYNPTTEYMVDNEFLSHFKKNIYLINTARGEIVNEQDIKHLLSVGRVKGYATDVLQTEYNEQKVSILWGGLCNHYTTHSREEHQ